MSATLERRGRRAVRFDPLRELRHTDARSAREAANWLNRLAGARKSPRTISEYGRIVDGLLGAYPQLEPGDFTDDELTAYIMSHREPSRPVVKSALNGWFKWLRKTHRIDANPMELVEDIKAREQTLVTIFSDTEAVALCGLPLPDGALMRLLLTTGVRRAEAIRLQVRHVNFDARHLEVLKGKGGADRLISLPPTLAGKLDHWFTTDGMDRDDHLWYCRPGGHWRDHTREIASSTFHNWWARSLADAGVEYRNPHCTRHTFATRSIRQGVPIDKVRRALGHKKLSTTVETYVHMSVEDMHDDFALAELP